MFTARLINSLKKIKPDLICPVIFIVFFAACGHKKETAKLSYDKSGYWWQLLSFNTDTFCYMPQHIAWVNACFKTQRDSVFYDTEHDVRDRFFIKIDSSARDNFLKQLISRFSVGDSVCAIIKTRDFFKQQFKSAVPYFCQKDSVIKVNFKIKDVLGPAAYKSLAEKIENTEQREIESFISSVKNSDVSYDSLGFYWLEKPAGFDSPLIKSGDIITISYEGSFLNGRIVDSSPGNFQVNYGTPDQLIKGLNYVIGRLKIGQISKIILPSHLAFGENGSSNGSIPPFTPMLYKISIIDKK